MYNLSESLEYELESNELAYGDTFVVLQDP